MSATIFGYVAYLPQVLVLGAGMCGFSHSGLWNDLGMATQSLPSLSALLFCTEYLGIIGVICAAVMLSFVKPLAFSSESVNLIRKAQS